MKIAVCAKHVPAGVLRLDPSRLRLDRSGDAELNPRDRAAVEAALRLRDAGAAAEVVLLSLGPPEAAGSLGEGLAMGADRGVLCADERAAGSDLLATSRTLARLVEREAPGLILFGQVAPDSEGAVLWGAVAHRLGRPALSQVVDLTLDDGAAVVRRQTETGHETLRAPLPCLVSVTDAFEPRFPSFREMKAAREKPVEVVGLEEVGLDLALVGPAGSGTEVLGAEPAPQSGREATIVEADGDAARTVLAFLVERGLA
jgi:electron transfer flavoprotein beta subunit